MQMVEEISQLIDRWLAENPRRSLGALAKRASIPYPTLRRIAQKENIPNVSTALPVLRIVATQDECQEFLLNHFPKVGQFVKEFSHRFQTSPAPIELNELVYDRTNFVILTLASEGISRQQLHRALGDVGVAHTDRLLELGVLSEEGDQLYLATCYAGDTHFEITDRNAILAQMKHCIDLFKLSHIGELGTGARLHTRGLSKKGLNELDQALQEFEDKLAMIFEREKGPYVTYITFLSDVLFNRGEQP